MSLNTINSAPLVFSQGNISDIDPVTDTYLGQALLLYPEIKKDMIRQVAEELAMPLSNKVLGYGRSVTENDLKSGKLSIAAEKIQWTVQPWLRQLFQICGTPSGDGAANSEITFYLSEDYGQAGMVLMFQDGNGNFENVILTSGATDYSSGCYSYTGKLVTNDPTHTFDADTFAVEGQWVGWSYDIVANCNDSATLLPVTTPAWLENYTSTTMTYRDICSTGIQTTLWVEDPDGGRCWASWEEYQMFQQYIKSFEMRGWYGTGTVTTSGATNLTDGSGNDVRAGYGVFEQIMSTGYIAGYSIATYNNPANYSAFLTFLENKIVEWSVQQGLTGGVELDLWAGINAYMLFQRVLKEFADQSGGCCYVMDYETGNQYEVKTGVEFKQYWFAGFKINLKKCAVFNDPSVQGYTATGTTTPWEAWKFVLMPDTTADGTPLIQYYSRAGCGTSNAFIHKFIPGSINPVNLMSPEAANRKKGYQVFFTSEGVWIVNDPGKILVGKPVA